MKRLTAILVIVVLSMFATNGFGAYRPAAVGDLFHKGPSGHDVRAYGAIGNGVDDDEPAFTLAIAAAAGGRLIIPEAPTSYKLSSNVTVPAGVTVEFQQGGLLSIDNAVTFTVNGTIEAGLYQIFSGAGDVVLAAGSCEHVLPQWWGAIGDNSTDNFAAFVLALDALNGGPGKMYIPAGIYKISATIDNFPTSYGSLARAGIIIEGAGSGETILQYTGLSGYLFALGNDEVNSAAVPVKCTIRDLHIQAPDLTSTGGGIEFSHSSFNQVEGVAFTEIESTYGIAVNVRNQIKTLSESGFTNDDSRDFTTTGMGATEQYAIKFTNSSNVGARVNSVTVRLGKTGTPLGTINAWIYSDSSGPDAALSTASAAVTNTALSAADDGADVTFSWENYADRAALDTGVSGWLVLITTGYTYVDGALGPEVRLLVDPGDGDESEFGTYATGGGGWSISDDGSNNTVNLRTNYGPLHSVLDNVHIYGDPPAAVGINLEDKAQLKLINSNIYSDLPLRANFEGILNCITTQFSSTGTNCMEVTATGAGKTYFHSGYLEGGSLLLDGGIHSFTQTQIPNFITSSDPTIVNVDGLPFAYLRGDNVGVKNDFWGNRVYPITSDSPLVRQEEMTLEPDTDALTGEAGETTTYQKGVNIFWATPRRAMLPRGSYLITIWAKKTDVTANNMFVSSIEKTSGGGNTTLAARNYALTTSYAPYRIIHVIAAGDATNYGSRLFVYKNSGNANKMSISHITMELIGEDELFSGNPVLYSPDKTYADGAKASELLFIGSESGTVQGALALIKASHDGGADDEKGKLEIKINDGDDGFSPTTQISIDSVDVTLERGILALPETTTPTDVAGEGRVYTKTDDRLYFQDGAGVERRVVLSDYVEKVQTSRYTTTQTLDATDQHVACDTDGAAFTVTLPAGVAGTEYRIANTGTSGNDLTLAPAGAELLIGVNSNFTLTDGESLYIVYEATEGWF